MGDNFKRLQSTFNLMWNQPGAPMAAPPIPGPQRPKLEPIDWNLVTILDPVIIRKANDYDSLQRLVQIFITANLQPGCSRILAHPLCLRLCQLLQIAFEYMNKCQTELQNTVQNQASEIQSHVKQYNMLQKKLNKTQVALKIKSQPYERCPVCSKKFKNIDYIDRHILNKHSELTDAWEIIRGRKPPVEKNDNIQVILEQIQNLRDTLKRDEVPQQRLEITQRLFDNQNQLMKQEEIQDDDVMAKREEMQRKLFAANDELSSSMSLWKEQRKAAPAQKYNIFNTANPTIEYADVNPNPFTHQNYVEDIVTDEEVPEPPENQFNFAIMPESKPAEKLFSLNEYPLEVEPTPAPPPIQRPKETKMPERYTKSVFETARAFLGRKDNKKLPKPEKSAVEHVMETITDKVDEQMTKMKKQQGNVVLTPTLISNQIGRSDPNYLAIRQMYRQKLEQEFPIQNDAQHAQPKLPVTKKLPIVENVSLVKTQDLNQNKEQEQNESDEENSFDSEYEQQPKQVTKKPKKGKKIVKKKKSKPKKQASSSSSSEQPVPVENAFEEENSYSSQSSTSYKYVSPMKRPKQETSSSDNELLSEESSEKNKKNRKIISQPLDEDSDDFTSDFELPSNKKQESQVSKPKESPPKKEESPKKNEEFFDPFTSEDELLSENTSSSALATKQNSPFNTSSKLPSVSVDVFNTSLKVLSPPSKKETKEKEVPYDPSSEFDFCYSRNEDSSDKEVKIDEIEPQNVESQHDAFDLSTETSNSFIKSPPAKKKNLPPKKALKPVKPVESPRRNGDSSDGDESWSIFKAENSKSTSSSRISNNIDESEIKLMNKKKKKAKEEITTAKPKPQDESLDIFKKPTSTKKNIKQRKLLNDSESSFVTKTKPKDETKESSISANPTNDQSFVSFASNNNDKQTPKRPSPFNNPTYQDINYAPPIETKAKQPEPKRPKLSFNEPSPKAGLVINPANVNLPPTNDIKTKPKKKVDDSDYSSSYHDIKYSAKNYQESDDDDSSSYHDINSAAAMFSHEQESKPQKPKQTHKYNPIDEFVDFNRNDDIESGVQYVRKPTVSPKRKPMKQLPKPEPTKIDVDPNKEFDFDFSRRQLSESDSDELEFAVKIPKQIENHTFRSPPHGKDDSFYNEDFSASFIPPDSDDDLDEPPSLQKPDKKPTLAGLMKKIFH